MIIIVKKNYFRENIEKKAKKCRIFDIVWPVKGRLVIFFSGFIAVVGSGTIKCQTIWYVFFNIADFQPTEHKWKKRLLKITLYINLFSFIHLFILHSLFFILF